MHDDEIKFKWKKFRRIVIALCVTEFLGLAGVLAWHGREDEIGFLSKDFFGDYGVISCAKSGNCLFSIILLELARCILFTLFYLVGQTKTLTVFFIVTAVESAFSLIEGIFGYIAAKTIFLDKTILLIWSLFISLAYVAAVCNIKYQIIRKLSYARMRETPMRTPKGFRAPPDEEAPINIQENSPLLKSLEHSVVLRSSNIIDNRLSRSISKDEVLSVNYDNNTTTFVDDATMYSAISQQKSIPQYTYGGNNNRTNSLGPTTPKKIVPSIPRLVALMLQEDGIPVKDIKYRFKMYKSVFTGADAVTWLMTRLDQHATTRQDGVALCQSLLDSGYIDDVYSNNPVVFEDSQNVFYRFSDSLQYEKLPVHSLEPANYHAADVLDSDEYTTISNYMSYSSGYRSADSRQPRLAESMPSVESGPYRIPRNDNNEEEEEQEEEQQDTPDSPLPPVTTEAPTQTSSEATTESLIPVQRQSLTVIVPMAGEPSPPQTPDANGPQIPSRISPSLQRFVAEMRNTTDGISVKDRKHYVSETQFIIYKKCFVGSEAVDWLMNKRAIQEREHAVKILQRLLTAGVIHHIQDKPVFQDDANFFLRFKEA